MPLLDGTAREVDLAPGYRLSAPGLRGSALVHEGRVPGTRDGGPEAATPALDRALAATGMNELMAVELLVQQEPTPPASTPLRTAAGEDGLELVVPDLGPTVGQVVMAIDEEGVVSWNLPEDELGQRREATTRGPGGSKRFVIRRTVAPTPPASEATHRGLVGVLGRKLLKVLVYPLTDAVLGPVSRRFAAKWEASKRPYRIRAFTPEDYASPEATVLDGEGLRRSCRGTNLLFIHGTFSTSHGAFCQLPKTAFEELYRGYGGRVAAFDHFTLSEDPEQNASWLADRLRSALAGEQTMEVDIVCHSRGGLVARALAGELGTAVRGLSVRRVVFVGTPNRGTVLADPDHMVDFLDRYTSLLNLAPPGPFEVVAEILEAVLTTLKVVGHGALEGLPGMAAMHPKGDLLRRLGAAAAKQAEFYAVSADFEPMGGLKAMTKEILGDQLMDRIFGRDANDLVVPTAGVFPGEPDPPHRLHVFAGAAGVSHTRYFAADDTVKQLKAWLL